MPYIIENSGGESIIIPDGGLNQDYSIDLVGRNYANYGEIIAKTQIDLLDNFASDATPPTSPTAGQLWYDKTFKVLRTYDSTTGAWLPNRTLVSSFAPTNTYGQNKAGTMYFNTATGQLYVNIGTSGYQVANKPGEISSAFNGVAALSSPTFYGTSLRNIFLTDTDGVKRAVLALYYRNDGENTSGGFYQGEKIVALISGHANDFTIADALSTTEGVDFNFFAQFDPVTQPGGIGLVIKQGINTRADDEALVSRSRYALRAEESYNLNTGSFSLNPDGTIDDGAGAITIPAANVFHTSDNSVPAVTNTYNLGNSGRVFGHVYAKHYYIGEIGGEGTIEPNGTATVTIGVESNPIDKIWVTDANVVNAVKFPTNGNVGEENAPANQVYTDNITVGGTAYISGYTLPTAVGTNGQQIYLGADSDTAWADPASNIDGITSTDSSIDISTTFNSITPDGTVEIITRTLDLSANVTTLREDLFSIASDDKSQESLSYDAEAGTLAYIRETPFDNLTPADHFMLLTTNQTASGEKTFTSRAKFATGINIGGQVHYGSKAVYPAGTEPDDNTNIQFTTKNSSNQDVSILFTDKAGIVANDDITAFSDRKLKENIVPISDALAKVSSLTGYTFNKIGVSERRTGLIAQEVEKVLPEAVHSADDTLSVAYGNMVGLLVQAIKELSDEVNELKSKLNK